MRKEPLHEKSSKYLDKDKATRFEELESKGIANLTQKESSEYAALMFEIVDQMEALGEFDDPFEGKCRRCGREFDNPVPEVTHPEDNREIASVECCADCNTLIMSVIFRGISAYRKERLYDPLRGGSRHANT